MVAMRVKDRQTDRQTDKKMRGRGGTNQSERQSDRKGRVRVISMVVTLSSVPRRLSCF